MPRRERAAALATVKPFPVLLVRGDGDALPAKYCNIQLLPNAEPANGLPSWSAASGSLHLYWFWRWRLNSKFTPLSGSCLAYIATPFGVPPPCGDNMWNQGFEFRGVPPGERLVAAPLTLVLGREANERVEELEVRVPALSL